MTLAPRKDHALRALLVTYLHGARRLLLAYQSQFVEDLEQAS
jgi:hypothetical protein